MKTNKLSQQIISLYNNEAGIVNDDARLICAIWWLNSKKKVWSYEDIKNLPNPETITRVRRKLHEEGLIKYSRKASERREEMKQEYKKEYSTQQNAPTQATEPQKNGHTEWRCELCKHKYLNRTITCKNLNCEGNIYEVWVQ